MESQGIPLTDILHHFQENNMIMDWVDFFKSARDHNWNIRTILARIEECTTDVYGKVHCQKILETLKMVCSSDIEPEE